MIQTVIHSQGIDISRHNERVIRNQIHRALGRFSTHVRMVSVHIKDVNGPRGGPDTSVIVRTRLRGRVELSASARRSRLLAASSSAVQRTRRQVKRAIRRQQSFSRMSFSDRSGLRPLGMHSAAQN